MCIILCFCLVVFWDVFEERSAIFDEVSLLTDVAIWLSAAHVSVDGFVHHSILSCPLSGCWWKFETPLGSSDNGSVVIGRETANRNATSVSLIG